MHHRSAAIAGLAVVLAAAGLGATDAAAKGPEVIRRGACSARADWKLKVGAEDRNRLETELEIEDGPRNASWRLVLRLNGTQVVNVVRQANAVGDVRLDRVLQGRAGADTVSFTATTAGQRCSGSATL
jgi:hypothetical protein